MSRSDEVVTSIFMAIVVLILVFFIDWGIDLCNQQYSMSCKRKNRMIQMQDMFGDKNNEEN